MPDFAYVAVSPDGQVERGTMHLPSELMLEQELEARGLMLVSSRMARSMQGMFQSSRRISRRDIIEMLIPWLAMEKAGVPLLDAIRDSLDEIANPGLQTVARQIANDLEAGDSLVEAASRHPKVFDAMSLGILQAGSESGRLDSSFEFLIRHHSWLDQMKKNVMQMMLEPGILLVVIVAFIVLMFSFVVPQIMETVAMFNVPMPWPTRMMFHLNAFFGDYGVYVVLLFAGLFLLLPLLYLKWPAFHYRVDELKLRLPFFGALNRMIVGSRFAHHLSALFRSGITLVDAMEIAARAVGNTFAEKEILDARERIIQGATIHAAMSQTTVFSPMVLRMLKVGEDSGNLDETLNYVSEYYDEEVPRRIARAFTLITPLITILLGIVVLFIALAVFLPMLDMIDKVHSMRH